MNTFTWSCAAVLVAGLASVGCSTLENGLRTRSAFDLSCNGDALQLTVLEEEPGCMNPGNLACARSVGVMGCGQKAVYMKATEGWVRNGEIQRVQ
jgi:hypothetical protein